MTTRRDIAGSTPSRGWMSLVLLCLALLPLGGLGAAPAVAPAPPETADGTLLIVADDNYPPFLFRDVDGAVQGYLVDYWDLWSRHTGVKVRLEPAKWADAQRSFLAGHGDVIDLIYRTAPREEVYDFSAPYADLPVNIYHHASISGITGVGTLRGFRVGVMEGDACVDELAHRGITNLALYPSYVELIEGAVRQDIKVFCLDEVPANFYFYRLGVQAEFRKGFTLYSGQFHRAVRKGDAATLALVERGMAAITDEEEAALHEKWFGTPVDLGSYARVAGIAGMAVLVCGIVLLLWNVSLRRKVRQSTLDLRRALDGLQEANRAERQSREHLAAALQASPDLLFEIDADGRYVEVFGSHDALLASPRETLIGRRVAEVLNPAAAQTSMESVKTALETGRDSGRIIRLDLPIGTRWFELSAARKEPVTGGPATVMVLSRDVTRRIEAEGELEAMRIRTLASERDRVFKVLFESSPVAMAHIRGTTFESVNRMFTQLFGYDLDELRTIDDWWRLAYPDPTYREACRAAWEASLADIAAGRHANVRDVNVTCADGTVRSILFRGQPVGDSWIFSLVDVTERNRAEAALRAAKQAAEQASLAKSQFLANMSHEIRTPLNGIIGMAHLIRESGLSAEQAERLAKLEAAADHLLQILSAILDLSKIEAGKVVLESRLVHLDDIVDNTMAMIEESAHAKGLSIAREIESVPGELLGDAVRLQQALLNYAHNAVKFTNKGSITFRARLVQDDESGALIRFEVTDSGIGVEPDALPRLFDSFEQADASTTRRFGGTGLGLAITRGLAELMGGEAGAESTLGLGSTFWFTARLAKGRAERVPASVPSRPVADSLALLRERHPGATVLLAEDNEINAEVAAAMLRRAGITVDLAVDGVQAVSKAAATDYALILMDVQMPTMNGLEATRRILEARPDAPPIIAMTANAFSEDRAACMSAGMSDFLGKPVEPKQLYATVLRWLDERAAAPG